MPDNPDASSNAPDADDAPNDEAEPSSSFPEEEETPPDGDSAAFHDALRAPIREDAPCGDSVLYEENFQALKTEINNISSAAGEADYERVVELARTVLTEQSKDLRAAGYLVIGEARTQGVEGVAEAVEGLHVLIDEYWEGLYPEASRMRSRGNALQFIADRLPDWIGATSFEAEDRAALVRIEEALEDIQAFSLDEMGEHAPSLSGLLNDLEGEIDALPAPEPESAPAGDDEDADGESSGAAAAPAEASSSTPAAPAQLTSEDDAAQTARTLASYYRDDDLRSPTSYRLIRTVRWGALQDAPPNEGGTTRFPAPREQRREYLEGLLADMEYQTLVQEAESSFQGGTFHVWLDLQRLVAKALEALGEPYRAAHRVVCYDTALLVERVPSLLTLAFKDGTPFARPLTVDWIEDEVRPLLQAGGEDEAGTGGGEALPVEDDRTEARKALGGGDLDAALDILREGRSQDASGREDFRRRLYAATLCLKGEAPHVAQPLLDELATDVQAHTLGTWAPSLAIEVWVHRCTCYDLLAQAAPEEEAAALRAKADASFEKVCQINPSRAVAVERERAS